MESLISRWAFLHHVLSGRPTTSSLTSWRNILIWSEHRKNPRQFSKNKKCANLLTFVSNASLVYWSSDSTSDCHNGVVFSPCVTYCLLSNIIRCQWLEIAESSVCGVQFCSFLQLNIELDTHILGVHLTDKLLSDKCYCGGRKNWLQIISQMLLH